MNIRLLYMAIGILVSSVFYVERLKDNQARLYGLTTTVSAESFYLGCVTGMAENKDRDQACTKVYLEHKSYLKSIIDEYYK